MVKSIIDEGYNFYMAYKITASERTNEKASDTETKALLYLMNFHPRKDDIDFFVIDFFNDVTGTNCLQDEAFDVQAKGKNNMSPKQLGRALVTLFKNYLSDLRFVDYILFVNGISSSSLLKDQKNILRIEDFAPKAQKAIVEGLKAEAKKKTYIQQDLICDDKIENFLQQISFVINDRTKEEYIRAIMQGEQFVIDDSDLYLQKIFDEIRKTQFAKKIPNVEGITIKYLSDFSKFNKHLSVNEIKLLVLSRLLNKNSLTESVPVSFVNYLASINKNAIEQKELIEDCSSKIFLMVYDKNNGSAYWKLFGDIYSLVKSPQCIDANIEMIYQLLPREEILAIRHLDRNAVLYFIALVKDSVK